MTRAILSSLLALVPALAAADPVSGAATPGEPATPAAAGTEVFTVARCVAIAREAAPEVQAAAAERLAARLDSTATARNGRPAWAVSGGATVAPEWSYDPVFTNLGEYQLKLGAELPVLDGGARRRDRAQAALASAGSAAERDRASRDAGLRAAALALGVLQRLQQSAWARDGVDWLARLATLIESGVRAGAQERADAVRVRIELDAVQAQSSAATEELGTIRRELAQLMGRDPERGVLVVADADSDAAPPTPADSALWLERAGEAPEERAARAAVESARLSLEQAQRRNAIQMSLAADAGLAGTDLTRAVPEEMRLANPGATFSDRLRRDLGASVSLEFRRPVLDAATGLSIRAREASLRAAEIRAATVALERRREVLDLLARSRGAADRLALARAAEQRADENLLRMRSLYSGGGSGLLELLDARRQLDEARTRLAEARTEVRFARWEGELRR